MDTSHCCFQMLTLNTESHIMLRCSMLPDYSGKRKHLLYKINNVEATSGL